MAALWPAYSTCQRFCTVVTDATQGRCYLTLPRPSSSLTRISISISLESRLISRQAVSGEIYAYD